jgi:hypothetical protein
VLDLFVMPFFRERTFPGRRGRLRTPLAVEIDEARYESAAREWHMDYAARYSLTAGDIDLGVHHFAGTGREPTLLAELDPPGNPVLIPFYEKIHQTGTDVQMAAGEWLLKLEGFYRTGQGESFSAGAGGFEYTFVRVADTPMDLGVIGEWAYDDRGDDASSVFENDAMFGLRLTANDVASSEVLAGIIQDLDSRARILSIEAGRRIGDRLKATLEGWFFLNPAEDDPLYALRDDDFLRFELAYYF